MAKEMPNVVVAFREKGITAISRSERGIVAMVLPDDAEIDGKTIYTVDDIPEKAADYSKEQIKLALKGYQLAPKKVLTFNVAATGEDKKTIDYTAVQKRLEGVRFDYVAIPGVTASAADDWATWIKGMRTTKDKMVKAVLPNTAADFEGVINFTNTLIRTASKTYTAADYCARIAGLIAGTPMKISCTYAPLPELVEVEQYTKEEMDAKVAKGEFFLFNDGEKIKVARGVNSFVTTIQNKGEDFQKIKMVDIMDMIHDDIEKTGHDSYIGKYANSYDNRCLLIAAINGYFRELERETLLERGQNLASVDLEATKIWLESNGLYTRDELESMKEQEIKEANIHDNVFIKAELSILDAIESIKVDAVIQ